MYKANKNTVKEPKGMKKVKAVKPTKAMDSPMPYKPTVYMSDKEMGNKVMMGQKVMLMGKVVGRSERERTGQPLSCNYDIEIQSTLAKGTKGKSTVKENY